jgi:hypothetical protein
MKEYNGILMTKTTAFMCSVTHFGASYGHAISCLLGYLTFSRNTNDK